MKNLIVRFAAIGALLIGMSVSVFAQVPSKMNYQAVVRDSEGNLVTEKPIGVRVAIINSQRTEVFAETQVVETNVNGLLTIEIGEGDHLAGSLDDISWASDSYSIVIGVDITGGVSYDIESVQSFMTVPYAFCAQTVETIDYSRVTNTPAIPAKVSDLTNDAKYVTTSDLGQYATKEDLSQIDMSEYAKVADLPVVPTKVSDLENDANYATKEELSQIDLTDYAKKTDLPVVPTKVSDLENDADYITTAALASYATKDELPIVPTKVSAFENDANYLVAADLADYAKIIDIPTAVSELENDKNYIQENDLNGLVLDILYAAFKDPEVRDAIIEDILSDTESIKKYGSEIVDMVLADPEYVNKLGRKIVDYLLNDEELTKSYVKKFIDIAKEHKELIKEYMESVLTNDSFKAYVKQYAKKYLTESVVNEFLNDFGKDKIISIVKNLGITEAIIADINVEQLLQGIDFVDLLNESGAVTTIENSLKSTMESSLQGKIEEAVSALLTYNAVSALAEVTVADGKIKGGCGVEALSDNAVIYSYGVCYGTTPYPSASDVHQEVGTSAGEASFVTPVLSAGTYYVRSYVASDKGMYYGAIQKIVIQ
ncbi:MAG: hypothetical protein IKJ98_00580 [Bacteroidales bacterium]|nr:hypothetical protein [Bacteroidales bacterium]